LNVNALGNSLLVRADFVLDRSRGGDRLTFKRWRRGLAAALPALMGFPESRALVWLRQGEEQGRYSVWLRVPVEALPKRKRLARIKAALLGRLEAALLAVGGDVIKLGVRRSRPRHELRLVAPEPVQLQIAPAEPELASA
jgi:hypothetical protein